MESPFVVRAIRGLLAVGSLVFALSALALLIIFPLALAIVLAPSLLYPAVTAPRLRVTEGRPCCACARGARCGSSPVRLSSCKRISSLFAAERPSRERGERWGA